MTPRRLFRRTVSAGAAVAVAAALCSAPAWSSGEPSDASGPDQSARYRRLLGEAWGPEPPERLDTYLGIREKLKPVFMQFGEGIIQWALREASTRPVVLQAQFGVVQLRRALDDELTRTGLTDDDFLRLTILVYGRWLRAVRADDPAEKSTLRALQELEVGLSRRLANNPPDDRDERRKLEDRLASVRFQARYIAPFGLLDKEATLGRIDPGTKAWLEAHRARIEETDFGAFDTAAPPRPKGARAAPARAGG
jgi:hypothetical protein